MSDPNPSSSQDPQAPKAPPAPKAPQAETASAPSASSRSKAAKAAPQPEPTTDVDVVLGAHAAIENLVVAIELLQAEQPSAATFTIGGFRAVVSGGQLISLTRV